MWVVRLLQFLILTGTIFIVFLFFICCCFRMMYLLGYIPKDNRLYLGDKELNIISFSLQQSVLEYQTAIMRKDFDSADQVNVT